MEARGVGVVDLVALAHVLGESRVLWKHQTDDLNLNLAALDPGESVTEHVNAEVDVVLVGVAGEGWVQIDGESVVLAPGQLIVIPKGVRRSIRCEHVRFVYLICHRRRAGLWPQERRRRETPPV